MVYWRYGTLWNLTDENIKLMLNTVSPFLLTKQVARPGYVTLSLIAGRQTWVCNLVTYSRQG